ncbi:MAG: hypothetical protein QJR08_03915 [Bacillota bacterium]|nr:hypothetical protein [Bacillota bacterium]
MFAAEPVEEVAPDLYRIDVFEEDEPGRSCAYLVRGKEGAALVETGSAPQVEALLDGIERAGFDPARPSARSWSSARWRARSRRPRACSG